MNPEEHVDWERAIELVNIINSGGIDIELLKICLIIFIGLFTTFSILALFFMYVESDCYIPCGGAVIFLGVVIFVIVVEIIYHTPLDVYQVELDYLYDKWGWQ